MRSTAAICVLLATVATTASSLEARSQCYDGVYTITARGTSEPQGGGVLEAIAGALTAAIPGSGSNEVVYPANTSFWPSVPVGVANAQQQMQDYYNQCPDGKMVIMGYSQGAFVMSVTLAGGNPSGSDDFQPIAADIGKNVVAVVMFGDPSRVVGQGITAQGANGAHCTVTSPLARTGSSDTAMQAYSNRLQDWCALADPVCCKTGTDVEAHLSYWSNTTNEAVVQFVQSQMSGASSSSSTTSASSTAAASSSKSAASSTTAASSSTAAASVSSLISALQTSATTAASLSSLDSSLQTAGVAAATKAASQSNATTSSSTRASATPSASSGNSSASSTTPSASPSVEASTGDSGRIMYSTVTAGLSMCSVFFYMYFM